MSVNKRDGVGPVSYTHLDVYKRQRSYQLDTIGFEDPRISETHVKITYLEKRTTGYLGKGF